MTAADRTGAWAHLLKVHAAVLPKLAKALLHEGMPITWYDVLLVLNAAPGRRLRMTELGEQAVVSRERVSRVVSELESAGLVERVANPDDRRSSFAQITAAGRARLRKAAPIYLDAIEKHYSTHLSDHEVTVINQAFARVLEIEARS